EFCGLQAVRASATLKLKTLRNMSSFPFHFIGRHLGLSLIVFSALRNLCIPSKEWCGVLRARFLLIFSMAGGIEKVFIVKIHSL
ncbi:MAG: hypothetical protein VX840_13380, partial [Pseudomonadota bacterium]|nr:hypothetical protein [Pseudomonadota bacterium]